MHLYEQKEGILVEIKDKIYFKKVLVELDSVSVVVLEGTCKTLVKKLNVFVKAMPR